MPIKYIGRTTDFRGKTLWEILGNLKNLGVGRYVVRNMFITRYCEPTYHKILKVETLPAPKRDNPHDNQRKVIALTEKIFRGRKATELVQLGSSTYKTDYLLVPKEDEERLFRDYTPPPQKVLPRTMPFPPLLEDILMRQMKAKGQPVTEPRLTVEYNLSNKFNLSRIAEEGETPDFEIKSGLERSPDSELYKNIKE